jgi:hypothetical protein
MTYASAGFGLERTLGGSTESAMSRAAVCSRYGAVCYRLQADANTNFGDFVVHLNFCVVTFALTRPPT